MPIQRKRRVAFDGVDGKQREGCPDLPPYTIVDLAAEYDLVAAEGGKRALTLSARLSNALDKQYSTVTGFRSPGRSLLVGVRVGYGL